MEERKNLQWSVPELIVLTRNTKEENVLLGCKQNVKSKGGGPRGATACVTFSVPCNVRVVS